MALNERFETNLQLNGLIMHLEGDDGGQLLGPSIVSDKLRQQLAPRSPPKLSSDTSLRFLQTPRCAAPEQHCAAQELQLHEWTNHSAQMQCDWTSADMCLFVCPIFVQRLAEVFFQQETVAALQSFGEVETDRYKERLIHIADSWSRSCSWLHRQCTWQVQASPRWWREAPAPVSWQMDCRRSMRCLHAFDLKALVS